MNLLYSKQIKLKPISKKNSQRIVKINNHYAIMPSKAFKQYEKDCHKYLYCTIDKPIKVPIAIQCIFYYPANKDGSIPKNAPDLTNLLEAIHDVLIKYKIIIDDNANIIKSVDGSRIYFTNEEPYTEVFISEYSE